MNVRLTRFNRGFTVVELAIVIAVIGILAGISIFGYGAWQKNIRTSQVKSDLKAAVAAMEDARNFNNEYPASIGSVFTPSKDVTMTGGKVATVKNGFCVQAVSNVDATIQFYATKSTTDGAGTCPPSILPEVPEEVLSGISYDEFLHWIVIPDVRPGSGPAPITSYKVAYRDNRADAWTEVVLPAPDGGWYSITSSNGGLVNSYENNVNHGQMRIIAVGEAGESEPKLVAYSSIQ